MLFCNSSAVILKNGWYRRHGCNTWHRLGCYFEKIKYAKTMGTRNGWKRWIITNEFAIIALVSISSFSSYCNCAVGNARIWSMVDSFYGYMIRTIHCSFCARLDRSCINETFDWNLTISKYILCCIKVKETKFELDEVRYSPVKKFLKLLYYVQVTSDS